MSVMETPSSNYIAAKQLNSIPIGRREDTVAPAANINALSDKKFRSFGDLRKEREAADPSVFLFH